MKNWPDENNTRSDLHGSGADWRTNKTDDGVNDLNILLKKKKQLEFDVLPQELQLFGRF